jgi:hypothetical protein
MSSSCEALAGLLRPGNAGSKTRRRPRLRAGHGDKELAPEARPGPEAGPRLLARADSPVLRTTSPLHAGKEAWGSASASRRTRIEVPIDDDTAVAVMVTPAA